MLNNRGGPIVKVNPILQDPPFILAPPDYQFSVMTQAKKKIEKRCWHFEKVLKLSQEKIDAKHCKSFFNSIETIEKKF